MQGLPAKSPSVLALLNEERIKLDVDSYCISTAAYGRSVCNTPAWRPVVWQHVRLQELCAHQHEKEARAKNVPLMQIRVSSQVMLIDAYK